MCGNVLINYDLDDISKYIFHKDILGKNITQKSLKEKVLSSKWVKNITDQQFEDGSWDGFHTLSSDSITSLTTENAIRRLLFLGLDINDEPIKKVLTYMEQFLVKKVDLRDRKEGLSDWTELTELFVAAWVLEIDNSSRVAGEIADKWALIITRSFAGDSFNFNDYSRAFVDIFNVKPGKRVWNIESFHIISILKDRLEPEIEEKFIDFIMNSEKGLYYINNRKLLNLPTTFKSRETTRFIYAHILLSRYSCYAKRCNFVVEWLMENRGEDGLWDFGSKVKDHVILPFSDSWRKVINRKIDSTLFIQKYLCKVEK